MVPEQMVCPQILTQQVVILLIHPPRPRRVSARYTTRTWSLQLLVHTGFFEFVVVVHTVPRTTQQLSKNLLTKTFLLSQKLLYLHSDESADAVSLERSFLFGRRTFLTVAGVAFPSILLPFYGHAQISQKESEEVKPQEIRRHVYAAHWWRRIFSWMSRLGKRY